LKVPGTPDQPASIDDDGRVGYPAAHGDGCCREGRVANDAEQDKTRNREIAENENTRQIIGDVRVSVWAVAVAVVIGLLAVGWVLVH
jgi:hypothetical protein